MENAMLTTCAPIITGKRPEFEGLVKYEVSTTKVLIQTGVDREGQPEYEARDRVSVDVFHGDWLSTGLPGIADTLKVMFNHCLDRPEMCHIDILELKACIDSIELAKGDDVDLDESQEAITDALLWIATNWGRLWT